jgi:hypothetical protein
MAAAATTRWSRYQVVVRGDFLRSFSRGVIANLLLAGTRARQEEIEYGWGTGKCRNDGADGWLGKVAYAFGDGEVATMIL